MGRRGTPAKQNCEGLTGVSAYMTGLNPGRIHAARETAPLCPRGSVDRRIVVTLMLLLSVGLVTLFSASYYGASAEGSPFDTVAKQLLGVAMGLVALIALANFPYWQLKRPIVVGGLLILSFALLVLVAIPGIGRVVNGSRRWLYLGPLSVQPSEIAKFAVVLFMATALTNIGRRIEKLVTGICPLMLIPGTAFLLILMQPNLSTAGSIIIVSIVMVLAAGAKWRHLGLMGIAGAVLAAYYAWSEPYRRERLLSFRDPFAKLSDEGYQLSQSLLAFGSGGLFGMGLGRGRQKFGFLPYPESDFIFAVVGEDMGLVGCVAVLGLFLVFIYFGLRVAMNCPDRFGSLLAAGITLMIGIQAFMNVAVVIGLMPTTGLPLPFFSAGGTSVSIFMGAVGILLNISRYTNC